MTTSTQRGYQYYLRKINGLFLTKPLSVSEKQFKSLLAWGAKNGVMVERFVPGGGARRKASDDGTTPLPTTTD